MEFIDTTDKNKNKSEISTSSNELLKQNPDTNFFEMREIGEDIGLELIYPKVEMDLVPAYTKALKLNNMGVELAKKNQILEAKHKFSEALMLFGGEARIYYNLACCEYAYTMFTCAEESCTECLKFDPVFPKAYLLRYKIKKEQEEEEENDANNDLLMYKELQERKNKNK